MMRLWLTHYIAIVVTTIAVLTVVVLHQAVILRHVEKRACGRVQLLRDVVNNDNEVIYRVLLAASYDPRITHQTSAGYRSFANAMIYQPPTNCHKASQHPQSYRPPAPVSMAMHVQTQAHSNKVIGGRR